MTQTNWPSPPTGGGAPSGWSAGAGVVSPDGFWRWDGARWVPNAAPHPAWWGFRSLDTAALWSVLTLGLWILGAVLVIVADVGRRSLTGRVLGGETVTAADVSASDNLVALSAVLEVVTLVLAAITFLIWLHRAVGNGPALGGLGLRFTPGWAVGWWFVPIANLVRPFQVVAEAWRTATPHDTTTSPETRARVGLPPMLPAWWLLFVIGGMLSRVAVLSRGDRVRSLRDAATVDIAASVVLIASAALCIAVVRGLTQRQNGKRAALAT